MTIPLLKIRKCHNDSLSIKGNPIPEKVKMCSRLPPPNSIFPSQQLASRLQCIQIQSGYPSCLTQITQTPFRLAGTVTEQVSLCAGTTKSPVQYYH